jgi:asparagine synthase (glutamine-hydrolysing)
MIRISGFFSKNKIKFSTKVFDNKFPYKKIVNINEKKKFKFIIHSKKNLNFSDFIYEDKEVFIFSFDTEFIKKITNKKLIKKSDFLSDISSSIYYDKKKHLFFKRSIFSANTIYYTRIGKDFVFASEIKLLLQNNSNKFTICKKILVNFLTRNYRLVFGRGFTFFNEIYEIQTACYIDACQKVIKQKKYWLPSLKNRFSGNPFKEFRVSIKKIIKDKLIGTKKPIFLVSGGMDSTLIASFAKNILKSKIHTISAIFTKSKKFDESFYIKKLTSKIGKNPIYVNMNDHLFVKWLKHKQKIFDQPLLSPVYILMNYINSIIEKKKHDVVFGGGGGDILSMGTYEYQPYIFADYLKISKKKYNLEIAKWNKNQKKFIRYWPTTNSKMLNLIRQIVGKNGKIYHNPDWTISDDRILNKEFFSTSDLRYVPKINLKFPLFIQSRIADEIFAQAMPTHFIEELNISEYKLKGCDPFLDKDLLEKCFNLEPKHITCNGYTKVLFRNSSKGILPNIIRLRKERTGLSIPIDAWFFHGPLNRYFKELLKNQQNKKILNINFVYTILKEHEYKIKDNSWLLWRILSFMIWKKNYYAHIKN